MSSIPSVENGLNWLVVNTWFTASDSSCQPLWCSCKSERLFRTRLAQFKSHQKDCVNLTNGKDYTTCHATMQSHTQPYYFSWRRRAWTRPTGLFIWLTLEWKNRFLKRNKYCFLLFRNRKRKFSSEVVSFYCLFSIQYPSFTPGYTQIFHIFICRNRVIKQKLERTYGWISNSIIYLLLAFKKSWHKNNICTMKDFFQIYACQRPASKTSRVALFYSSLLFIVTLVGIISSWSDTEKPW